MKRKWLVKSDGAEIWEEVGNGQFLFLAKISHLGIRETKEASHLMAAALEMKDVLLDCQRHFAPKSKIYQKIENVLKTSEGHSQPSESKP